MIKKEGIYLLLGIMGALLVLVFNKFRMGEHYEFQLLPFLLHIIAFTLVFSTILFTVTIIGRWTEETGISGTIRKVGIIGQILSTCLAIGIIVCIALKVNFTVISILFIGVFVICAVIFAVGIIGLKIKDTDAAWFVFKWLVAIGLIGSSVPLMIAQYIMFEIAKTIVIMV